MPADGDYQGRSQMPNMDHPAILKPQASSTTIPIPEPLEAEAEPKKLLYRQYTCDPQGLAALCCDLDSKGYEPVQIVPGFFGSGVQGPFHSAMGWTVLARLKYSDWSSKPDPIGDLQAVAAQSFSSSVEAVKRGKRK